MKKLLLGIAALCVVITVFLTYVVFTESGLKFLVSSAEKISMGSLQVGDVSGKLSKKFSIEELHYDSDESTFQVKHAELFWNPAALWRGELHVFSCIIENVEYSYTAPEKSEENEAMSLSLPSLKMPLDMILEDLRVRNVQIISSGETVAEIDRVDLQLRGGATLLQFDTIYLQGKDFQVNLSGEVGVDRDWPVDITGTWRYLVEGIPELQGNIRVNDSLKDAGINLALTGPYAAELVGRLQFKDGGIGWQAQLEASGVDPAILFDDIPGLLDIHAKTDGMWKEEIISGAISIENIEGKVLSHPIQVKGTAQFDNEKVEIGELHIGSGEARATVKGVISDKLDLSYILYPVDTNIFVPWLSGVLSGEGRVLGKFTSPAIQTVLVGRELAGNGVSIGTARADLQAGISESIEKSKVNAALSVKDADVEGQHIDRASLDLKGSLESHTVHLEIFRDTLSMIMSANGGWKETTWKGMLNKLNLVSSDETNIKLVQSVPITVAANSVDIGDLCLGRQTSMLCINGRMRDNKWQAGIELDEFDPAYLLENWPGKLNAKARVEGEVIDKELSYIFDLTSITGNLKGVPVSGSGKVQQKGNLLSLKGVNLLYGDAQLTANGRFGDAYDIDFFVKIPELKNLTPEAKGTFDASGTLYGSIKEPVVDFDFSMNKFTFEDISIAHLQGDVGVDLLNEGRVEAVVRGSDIQSNGVEISAVSLMAEGTATDHLFMVNAETTYGTAAAQGTGSYDTGWKGIFESARFALGKYGTWTLRKDAVVEVGAEKSSLENFCLQADDASICLQGSLKAGQEWAAQASLNSIPLRMISDSGVSKVPIQGLLQGSMEAAGNLQGISAFKADVVGPQIILRDRWRKKVQYQFSENRISAFLDGDALQVKVGSRFQESGKLRGVLLIDDFRQNVSKIRMLPLRGELDFDVGDISFVSILTDGRFQPKGTLRGDFAISGSVGEPAVQGNVDLQGGEVFVAGLGILLQDISVNLLSETSDVRYTLKASSGPGDLLSNGIVKLMGGNGLVLSGTLTGKEFEIMKTEEYNFHVSPDLKLEYGGSKDSITGSLAVPYGRITLQRGPGAVTSTDDVIIVDAEEPAKRRDSQFFADIDVRLGKDVKIDAYGLKSDLVGGGRIIDKPGKNLAAQGELIVLNGQFSLYSAELNITRGRLLFSGGNVENPGVDVRAQRKIENKLVGVNVSGTAQDLEFQLFSEPPMEESNVLAYILFGRPMYGSSGTETSFLAAAANALGIRGANTVTNKLGRYVPVDEIYLEGDANQEDLSIVLGKRITKDLFIGYGHNFFEELGEFKIQYQLGNNFSIETKSSVESTSGDILYTIER